MHRKVVEVALVLGLALAAGCAEGSSGPDPACEAWLGTYRGEFSGNIEGASFDLQPHDFQLDVVWSYGEAVVEEAMWTLGNGYRVELLDHQSVSCDAGSHDFDDDTICFLHRPDGEQDNCDFTGSLWSDGEGSGTFTSPAEGDRSPEVWGEGTWTFERS